MEQLSYFNMPFSSKGMKSSSNLKTNIIYVVMAWQIDFPWKNQEACTKLISKWQRKVTLDIVQEHWYYEYV